MEAQIRHARAQCTPFPAPAREPRVINMRAAPPSGQSREPWPPLASVHSSLEVSCPCLSILGGGVLFWLTEHQRCSEDAIFVRKTSEGDRPGMLLHNLKKPNAFKRCFLNPSPL